MSNIKWMGNMDWDTANNDNQPWDHEIAQRTINAKTTSIPMPEDPVKAATPYIILPMLLLILCIRLKAQTSSEFIFDARFAPISFLIGCIVAMPLHEYMHALGYPRNENVYIGVCLKQFRAFAISSAPLTRNRYILMSLLPIIPGLIFLFIFCITPVSMKWLISLCVFPMFMGILSLAPDYMSIVILLKNVPSNALVQATMNDFVWYINEAE